MLWLKLLVWFAFRWMAIIRQAVANAPAEESKLSSLEMSNDRLRTQSRSWLLGRQYFCQSQYIYNDSARNMINIVYKKGFYDIHVCCLVSNKTISCLFIHAVFLHCLCHYCVVGHMQLALRYRIVFSLVKYHVGNVIFTPCVFRPG